MRGNPAALRVAPGIDQEMRSVPFSSRIVAFASGGGAPSSVATFAVKPRNTTDFSPSVNARTPSMRPRSPYATPAPYTTPFASRRQRPATASVPDARAAFAAASAVAPRAVQSDSSGVFGCGPTSSFTSPQPPPSQHVFIFGPGPVQRRSVTFFPAHGERSHDMSRHVSFSFTICEQTSCGACPSSTTNTLYSAPSEGGASWWSTRKLEHENASGLTAGRSSGKSLQMNPAPFL